MGFFKKAIFSMAKEMDKQRRKDYEKSQKLQQHQNKVRQYQEVIWDKYDRYDEILSELNLKNIEYLQSELSLMENGEVVPTEHFEEIVQYLNSVKTRIELIPRAYDLPSPVKKTFYEGVDLLLAGIDNYIQHYSIKLTIAEINQIMYSTDSEEVREYANEKLDEIPNPSEFYDTATQLLSSYLSHYEESHRILENL
jgi:hypothetical protein